MLLFILRERRRRMPYLPVVYIAHALRIGIILKIRTRRTGPIRPRRIERGRNFGQHAMKNLFVIVPEACRQSLFPAPMLPPRLDLIVAAPDDDARMISQPRHVIEGFMPDVIQKLRSCWIHAAGEHEFLPDQNSHFIARIVKIVALVDAAAPDAQHVHVRLTC